MFNVYQIHRLVTDGTLPRVKTSPTGCGVCVKEKFRKSYPGILTKSKTVGHLRADTKRMIKDSSVSSTHYFFFILDDCSLFVQALPIIQKSEASEKVLQFVKWFELKSVQPDRSLYTGGVT